MTDTQQIISLIKEQGREIKKLSRMMKGNSSDEWLTAQKVTSEFGVSKKFLQLKRKDGTIKNFRCLESGKNFHYHRSEIEALFKMIKN